MEPTDDEINIAKLAAVLDSIESLPDDLNPEDNEQVHKYIHEVLLSDNDQIRERLRSGNSD
jgi:hypothetical protein